MSQLRLAILLVIGWAILISLFLWLRPEAATFRYRATAAVPRRHSTSDEESDGNGTEKGSQDKANAHAHAGNKWWKSRRAPLPPPPWFGQRGVRAQRIAGKVTFQGMPVAGALVALASVLTEAGYEPEKTVVTGAGGEFDLSRPPADRYLVAATFPGRTPDVMALDTRDPTADPSSEALELRLGTCEASIAGAVTDGKGVPIGAARVIRGERSFLGAGVHASDKGRYELCLPPGRSTVRIEAEGHGAVVYELEVHHPVRRDFVLPVEGIIAGETRRALDGKPVRQALVRFEPVQAGSPRAGAVLALSDEDGEYHAVGLAAGRYRMTGYGDALIAFDPVVVSIESDQLLEHVHCRLGRTARLRGIVANGNLSVPGARVLVGFPAAGRWSDDGIAQADGSFAVEQVPYGDVHVRVEHCQVNTSERLRIEGPEQDGVAIDVTERPSIRGRVLRGGRPVAEARVELDPGASPANAAPSVVTNSKGSFIMGDLGAGTYVLAARGEREGAAGRSAPIVLAAGLRQGGVVIDLDLDNAISGVVTERDGTPVEGVVVRLGRAHGREVFEPVTAPDGSFTAAALPPDSYHLEVRLAPGSPSALLPAPESAFPTVTLRDRSSRVEGVHLWVRRDRQSLAGKIFDVMNAGVPHARVLAARLEPSTASDAGSESGAESEAELHEWSMVPAATTVLEGNFLFAGLLPGLYTLEVNAADGARAVVPRVATGKTDLAIRLDPPGGIDGVLADYRQEPDVIAYRVGAGDVPIRGESDGRKLSFRELPPGPYLVVAADPIEADLTRVEVRPGVTATVALRSHRSSSLEGKVLDFESGKPIGGLRCRLSLRQGEVCTPYHPAAEAYSDEDGHFAMPVVPIADLFLECGGPSARSGLMPVTVEPWAPARVEVRVVQRRGKGPLADLGARFDASTAAAARLVEVKPGGPAARAGLVPGDVLLSVDGAPVNHLGADAAVLLLRDRVPGSRAKLDVQRGGATVHAELIAGEP